MGGTGWAHVPWVQGWAPWWRGGLRARERNAISLLVRRDIKLINYNIYTVVS